MSLQTRLLTSLRTEMDARALAIGNSLDRCVEAEALAEALQHAGLDDAKAVGYSALRGETGVAEVWVMCLTASKACDIIEAIFKADLVVADLTVSPTNISRKDPAFRAVDITFHGIDVEARMYLPADEAVDLVRAFKPERPAPDLIGRSLLTEEVPA